MQNIGKIVQIIGAVVDIRFSKENLPKLLNSIEINNNGTKLVVEGRIQTGSYTNRDGMKVYTTDVIVEEQEFAESKASSEQSSAAFGGRPSAAPSAPIGDGFMNIPDGLDEELPFS